MTAELFGVRKGVSHITNSPISPNIKTDLYEAFHHSFDL